MRWIVVCLLVAAGFWFYSNQPRSGNDPGTSDALMQECMAKKRYAASRMGVTGAGAERDCAEQHNLYHEDGHWYSY
ncbi:hypothetical protein [Haliea sp. E17]|uniref:hypothetical protein n=1 Tax=Haliea sp. E17 TaxID=3401576 RepID=UPI003AAB4708